MSGCVPGSYGRYYSYSGIWANLRCQGNESSIYNCTHSSSRCYGNNYKNYAAVHCYNGSLDTGWSLVLWCQWWWWGWRLVEYKYMSMLKQHTHYACKRRRGGGGVEEGEEKNKNKQTTTTHEELGEEKKKERTNYKRKVIGAQTEQIEFSDNR